MSTGRVGLYAVDQDLRTTATIGVFNYTRRLIHGLADIQEPGFSMVLWLSASNAESLSPASLPPWMQVRSINSAASTGWRRLRADHLQVRQLVADDAVDVVHFPKGWMPLIRPRRARSVATLHDTILHYCREHDCLPPGSDMRWRYFEWMLCHALNRADLVIAPSPSTADSLAAISTGARGKIRTVPTGAIDGDVAPLAVEAKRGVLVMGSTSPHKATAETLMLLDGYARTRDSALPVTVVGLDDLDGLRELAPPQHLEITCTGRISNEQLQRTMQQSRVLAYLSLVEGFGLPLLEAYSTGTAVCYRDTSALADVMDGIPGGWDGQGHESFVEALDRAMALSTSDILDIRQDLRERFPPERCIADTVSVYREALSMS